jgi:hypothetical protein
MGPMTVVRRNGLDWVAYRDGLAHATRSGALRTLCGAIPTPSRYAWPIGAYCAVCRTLEQAEAGKERARKAS